jgi:hypothetical protein
MVLRKPLLGCGTSQNISIGKGVLSLPRAHCLQIIPEQLYSFDFDVHSVTRVLFLPMVGLISLPASGSSSFWAFVLIFLLISYNAASMPYCVKDCNCNFANDAALSRHHKACPVLKSVRQRSQDIRRDKGIGGSLQNTTTLLTRKQRLQVSDYGHILWLSTILTDLQVHLIGTAPDMGSPSAAMEVDKPFMASHDSLSDPSMITEGTSPSEFSTLLNLPVNTPPPIPLLTQSGCPRRDYRLPKRFHNNLPEPPAPVPNLPSNRDHTEPHPVRRVILIVCNCLVTVMNSFGIWRDYPERPSVDPDALLTIEDLSNTTRYPPDTQVCTSGTDTFESSSPHWPFLNATVHSIMRWLNNGQTVKSKAKTTRFVHNVILSSSFNQADLTSFDAHCENQWLDKALSQSALRSQFIESSVDILVPLGETGVGPKMFKVPGLLHRKLTSVIQEAFRSPLAHLYHYSPFRLFQKSPISGKDERVYGEIYTSDAFLAESEWVQRHALVPPDDLDCKQEKVVAALMISSNATMLTDFGTAKAWPIYLMLGNLSKYIRAQPDSGAMHHLAYIPSVSFLLF